MRVSVNAQLTHVGIFVRDLAKMIGFYQSLLGLVLTDSGPYRQTERIAFLSRSPQEHHQLVLATGRPVQEHFCVVNQLSFRVDDLEQLRAMDARLGRLGIATERTVSHGNAWSIYLLDPEGNKVEIYVPSAWYVPQPFGHAVDLRRPASELIVDNDAMVGRCEGVLTRAEWSRRLAERIQRHDAEADTGAVRAPAA